MRLIKIVMATGAVLAMTSCASNTSLRSQEYALLYEQKPKTIAVMPPINETNFEEAKDYFYTTLATPLIDKGYYVFSPYLTMEMFQTEGAYNSEMFIEGDLNQFKNVLGCDAVMFTRIKKWEKKAVGGVIKVNVEYLLRSAETGETLYQREGEIKLDTSVKSGGNSLLGSLVSLAATAIKTATTDKVVAGRACNRYVLADMPEGPYSPLHDKDGQLKAWKGIVKASVKAN